MSHYCRLFAYSEEPLEANERLAIKLPNDFYKSINVIFGPGFDKEKHSEDLIFLAKQCVHTRDSIYGVFYSDFARSFSGHDVNLAGMNGLAYAGKSFSGTDPWGDKLTIEIIDNNNVWVKWRFINDVNINNENNTTISINKEFVSYFQEGPSIHFDIFDKKRMDYDPYAFFIFSYEGIIIFVDGKLMVDFNTGSCVSKLFGGSGADTYHESGGWRNAMNGKICELALE